jgi:hypothetical protein
LEFPNSNEIDLFKKTEYDFSDKLDATLFEVAMDIYERVEELCAVSKADMIK